jgi:outer membrane receptor for ferrienterochelin and colicin
VDDRRTSATRPGRVAREQEVEISVPGADLPDEPDIVITGSRRATSSARAEVVSVLSNEDIERTGEGDIAGALARVTGLSVVGNGFVFVRGLGDRYSLALLNGSPCRAPSRCAASFRSTSSRPA